MVLRALDGAVLVAHNASFEQRFLGAELRRLGADVRAPTLCTLRLARAALPDRESHRLEQLAPLFDIRNPAPHRALGDCFTALWLLLALLERQPDRASAARMVEAGLRHPGLASPWVR